jgi:hypothetical protein
MSGRRRGGAAGLRLGGALKAVVAGGVLVAACLLEPNMAGAQGILIFRSLENNASQVSAPDIVLDVEISAFAPLRKVTVNGAAQPVGNASFLNLSLPYRLKPGDNAIAVEASTDFETATREFHIIYRVPGTVEKRPVVHLVAVLGQQANDNAQRAPQGVTKTGGTRSFAVLMPRFDITVGETSDVRLGMIVSRDSYDPPKLSGEEAAFTQGSAAWVGGVGGDEWSVGVAYNYIDKQQVNIVIGKIHLEEDALAFFNLRRGFGKSSAFDGGLEVKKQDIQVIGVAPDNDPRAMANSARIGLETGLGPMRGAVKTRYVATDAVGKYRDNTTTYWSLELTYPVGDFVLTGVARGKQVDYALVDPALGLRPNQTQTAATANVSYSVSKRWVLSAEYLNEQTDAAVPAQTYGNTGITGSLIFLY